MGKKKVQKIDISDEPVYAQRYMPDYYDSPFDVYDGLSKLILHIDNTYVLRDLLSSSAYMYLISHDINELYLDYMSIDSVPGVLSFEDYLIMMVLLRYGEVDGHFTFEYVSRQPTLDTANDDDDTAVDWINIDVADGSVITIKIDSVSAFDGVYARCQEYQNKLVAALAACKYDPSLIVIDVTDNYGGSPMGMLLPLIPLLPQLGNSDHVSLYVDKENRLDVSRPVEFQERMIDVSGRPRYMLRHGANIIYGDYYTALSKKVRSFVPRKIVVRYNVNTASAAETVVLAMLSLKYCYGYNVEFESVDGEMETYGALSGRTYRMFGSFMVHLPTKTSGFYIGSERWHMLDPVFPIRFHNSTSVVFDSTILNNV